MVNNQGTIFGVILMIYVSVTELLLLLIIIISIAFIIITTINYNITY